MYSMPARPHLLCLLLLLGGSRCGDVPSLSAEAPAGRTGERPTTTAPVVQAPPAAASGESRRPRAAILYFDYDGPDTELAGLRKGFAQMLIGDAAADSRIEVVERAKIQAILDELKLNESSVIDQNAAVKVGKLLGAEYLVLGGYFDVMSKFRVDARLVETETSKVLCSVGETGAREDFLDLEQRVGVRLVSAIATRGVDCRPAPPQAESPTKKPKKMRMATAASYSKALDAVDRKDSQQAKVILAAVVKEAPDFLMAALDLAALEK